MRDLLVVGSGPGGAQAAKEAVEAGASVVMLDVGFDDETSESTIPYGTFSTLRRTDPEQRRYLLGQDDGMHVDVNDRIGAHFTPPRSYIKRGVHEYIPIRSQTFFPELSLALGGLGAGWGSGSQIFEPFELELAGLPIDGMKSFYEAVARDVGLSGGSQDDTGSFTLPEAHVQKAADLDSNAAALLDTYLKRRAVLIDRGFRLGRIGLAMLTENSEEKRALGRGANPYLDMDFYSNVNRSVYRPKYTIEELRRSPNFAYVDRALVERFEESPSGVTVHYRDIGDGSVHRLDCRRLLLAANAINSARIVLRSKGAFGVKQPLLCNPYHYVPAVNLRMLGRDAADRRHSLAQLGGVYKPPHRNGENVFAAFFSYRSLMHFRLVREMPLPPSLGLIVSRVLQNCLTIVGVHHPERSTDSKWVQMGGTADDPMLEASYGLEPRESSDIDADMKGILECLRTLGCFPLQTLQTPPGSSIHYAGTLPFRGGASEAPINCDDDGRLAGSPNVFIADSSTWRYLPAKGPTFTIMANARRVTKAAVSNLP